MSCKPPTAAPARECMLRTRARPLAGWIALACLLGGGPPGGSQQPAATPPGNAAATARGGAIGTVVVVQGEALAIVPGQPPRQLKLRDPVPAGLRVRLTGRGSVLQVRFFRAAPDGIGTYTLSGRSEAVIDQGPARPEVRGASAVTSTGLVSRIELLIGRLRLALLPGRGEAAVVETPQAVVGIRGTYARILVDPAVGTFVAVDEGTAIVQARAGGRPALVGAGGWVLVPPGGVPSHPESSSSLDAEGRLLGDAPLLGCCVQIEPPKPRQ